MKYPMAGDLQRATGVQITSNPSPKYSERRGWTGGDSRTLYAIEDQRTGRVIVRPGGELAGIGSEALVRIATRAEAEEHWQGQLHAGWHVAESNPHAPKHNPWDVYSDSGLEGVFFDEDSARFFAEEIRGGGATSIRVERRVRQAHRRNPPSGRWAGASRTITTMAQNLEVLGPSGCNNLLKYVPVEVAGVGYGWLFKCLPDGHDVVVELDGGGMQTFAASQVTPVAGRVPEPPTQLALRAKYKAEDEEEARERGNPSSSREAWQGAYRHLIARVQNVIAQGQGVDEAIRIIEQYDDEVIKNEKKVARELEEPFSYERAFKHFLARVQNVIAQDKGVDEANRIIEQYAQEILRSHRLRGRARQNPLAPSFRSVAGIAGNWNVEMQDPKYGTWKVTDWDVSREYAEGRVAWIESKGGRARAVQGNPIEMHENPARVTRERYGDSADIVIEHNRYGYTGWLESKRGGGRRPISFGSTKPTNAQEALALAKKFLAGVHGRNNPSGTSLRAKGRRK